MALQAVIAGLLAGAIAAAVAMRSGLIQGICTGLLIICSPYLLFLVDTAMADNLLALLVVISTYAWNAFYHRRSVSTGAAFAGATAAAILTKGSGIGLLLLPVIFLACKRDWRFFLFSKFLYTLAFILAVTVPWYGATYRLAANGFVYSWGWSYTHVALPEFAKALYLVLGLPCTIGFLFGLVSAFVNSERHDGVPLALACSATSMFLFVVLVPADITSRYLIPIVPCAFALAVPAIFDLAKLGLSRADSFRFTIPVIGCALIGFSIWQTFRPPHVEPFNSQQAVASIVGRSEKNPLILISGSTRFEGAMIASLAETANGSKYYGLRATKVLASGNFMGSTYEPRFKEAAELKKWLRDSQIGWVALDASEESSQFSHNRLLLSILADEEFHRVWEKAEKGSPVMVYQTPWSEVTPTHLTKTLADQAPSGIP
jgi:hypothetical protein